MLHDERAYVDGLDRSRLRAVECSSATWSTHGWAAHTSLEYPEFDLCSPPPDHETYDVVFCEQVLEHVVDPIRAARTLFDLCAPGGRVVVSTPFLVRVHKAPGDYWRFTDDGLRLLLERAGLEVEVVKQWGNRRAVAGNLWRWPAQRWWRSLSNVDDAPVVVWAYARRPVV
jgi:SAM-dependent methyltransferase